MIEASDQFAQRATLTLVESAKRGDRQAYQQLYQQHVGKVYSLCLRLTGDRALAEDATQEVFLQLWRKLDNYRGDSKFSTWLHSVTSHVCISYLRKQKGWIKRMFNIEDTEAMYEVAEASTSEVDLDAYIRRLPERARVVFVLHAVEGYRHEDIADMTGMAVGSSKAQFHRAKHLLQEWMGYEEH
ncbi:RNA polymerase sigma factor [Aliiglaciecola sp. CAU 1673]|uniref:RNA polymerase sigma factor n=1 Tax=Aliiglaciecola sp. CAU 1673 TaxID=3032595 RepID=UPI0023DAD1C2|nr:RNA polymerase sigma factor [Aliiglaciecola sp. CAU 1673]MDF2180310.1 RNA polymerase sigma factor [Aliiglaciecola sp. CAU 1673]